MDTCPKCGSGIDFELDHVIRWKCGSRAEPKTQFKHQAKNCQILELEARLAEAKKTIDELRSWRE